MFDDPSFPAAGPACRIVIPRLWHQRLLERFIERPAESIVLARVASSRWRDGSTDWLVREFLQEGAALADARPDGQFFVLAHGDGFETMSRAAAWFDAWPSQIVGVLVYGTRPHGQPGGWVREGGVRQELDQLILPGPAMLRLPLRARAADAGDAAASGPRFSRTVGAFGAEGVASLGRMQAAPVVIFGGSRTGLLFAEWAVKLGIPVLLCDPKPLKISHLGEISILGEEDVGRPKVEAFARRVGEWSLATAAVETFVAPAQSPAGVDAARRAALVVDCLDTDSGCLAAALLAVVFHKPHLSIAAGSRFDEEGRRTLGADIRLTLPGDRCCLCAGGLTDYPRAVRELAAAWTATDREDEPWTEGRAGSLRSVSTVCTGVGQRLVEDLYLGRVQSSRWTRLLWSEDGRLVTQEPEMGPRPAACPLCRKAGEGDAALGIA